MTLRGVQPKDEIIVQDHLRGAQRYRVISVDETWVTATKAVAFAQSLPERFNVQTGRWDHKNFGHQRTAYTMAQWERLGCIGSLVQALDECKERATTPYGLDSIPTENIRATEVFLRSFLRQATPTKSS